MIKLGIAEFPNRGNKDEVAAWSPLEQRRYLATRVLAVAQTRIEGTWRAYIKDVVEPEIVLLYGNALPEAIARSIFPQMKGIPYAS